jgi:two-component system response regulator AlgR
MSAGTKQAALLKVLVVDDEPPARMRLKAMVDAIPGYRVVADADNGENALKANGKFQPDIVLLDIRMPGMDGLLAARHLSEQANPPAIIFCTAFDEHALAAFQAQAVGYLLKPVSAEQLATSLTQAQAVNRSQLANIGSGVGTNSLAEESLSVKTHNGHELLPLEEVRAFIADKKYVSAYTQGKEILLDQSLKELESRFSQHFVRVHRNALVATRYIRALEKARTSDCDSSASDQIGEKNAEQLIIRLDGTSVTPAVSRRHLPDIRRLLKAH